MIGSRLKLVLKVKNLSQNKLASILGISSGNISEIIQEKNLPSASTLTLLSERLNVNINWLLTGDGAMFTSKDNDVQDKIKKLEGELRSLREKQAALAKDNDELESKNKELNIKLIERYEELLGLQDKLIKAKC